MKSQGSILNIDKVMAVSMKRCRLLLQKLTGYISEVSNQNRLNFGLVWFTYGANMCTNFFKKNLRGYGFFRVEWPCHRASNYASTIINVLCALWLLQTIATYTICFMVVIIIRVCHVAIFWSSDAEVFTHNHLFAKQWKWPLVFIAELPTGPATSFMSGNFKIAITQCSSKV